MDFKGNEQAQTYFKKCIEHIINKGDDKGFLLLSWPQYIGKMTLIESVIDELVEPQYQLQDLMILRDLSDQWLQLKKLNDKIVNTTHVFKIDTDYSKFEIKLLDGSIYNDFGAREIMDWLDKSPIGKRKLLVMENIERMNKATANAFLKTLEEPLKNRIIICTCSNIQQLLPTIVSRALLINFYENAEVDGLGLGRMGIEKRIAYDPVFQKLAESVKIIDENFLKTSLFSKQFELFTQANDMWVLDLLIWALQVKFVNDPIWSAKFIQAKKYLNSNIWVNTIINNLIFK
mgnify:FL=1|jgi:DNA polymerase III delta prime subunit